MYSHFVMVVDCFLALSLFFTMFYLSKIKKDIRNIKYYQKDLTHFSDHFSDSIKRSEHTLKGLYTQKEALDKDIRSAIQQAAVLLEDLKYATERAEHAFLKLSQPSPSPSYRSAEPLNLDLEHTHLEPLAHASPKGHARSTDMQHMTQKKRQEALRKVLSKLR